MLFRQLFDPQASAYTYLIGCPETRRAALIDPVLETVDRDIAVLAELGLTLGATIETHIHADHVTGAGRLRELTGSKVAVPALSGASGVDLEIREGEPIMIGKVRIEPLHTPGHTADHHAYLVEADGPARLFTGDALLIDGCGRTDFQGGDSSALYRAVHQKLFSLADETLVYPGHDYQQRRVSSIGQEKARNARLGGGKTLDEFVAIMAALDLPRPKLMDLAVPANQACGVS